MTIDAQLIELPNGDTEIVDSSELFAMPEWIADLTLLASFDHSLRTADETAFVIGCECAWLTVMPIIAIYGHSMYWPLADYAEAWNTMWSDGTTYSGTGWADDPDTSQALHDWCQEMEGLASGAGLIVDSNGDCGMTWIYVPVPEW